MLQTYANTRDNYSFQYPAGYEVRAFDEFGSDVDATSTSASIGVRKSADLNNEFIFLIREDGDLAELSEDAVKQSILKAPNPADFTISATTVAGTRAYKASYHGDDPGIVSDSYWVQNPGQRVLDITVVTKHYDSRQIRDAQRILNTFTFTK